MAERSDRVEEEVEAAFLKAVDSYWHDPRIILGSESDKIRYVLEHLKRLSRDWDRPGTILPAHRLQMICIRNAARLLVANLNCR